jgi:16S rRNA G1207 methylase RsmC
VSDHYFARSPQARSRPQQVRFRIDGRDYELTSDRGTFSPDRLDAGTGVLLRSVAQPSGTSLLDLGCGYGPLTCVLAERAPAATVWAVDVNERALGLTQANAAALGLQARVRVAAPEQVPADVTFDEIWSNPPVRIGKPALHALLQQWLPRLRPGGRAWLVVARNLGADSLAQWLTDQGWACRRQASAQGYRVLEVSFDRLISPDVS